MADVVTFELEAGTMLVAQLLHHGLDVLERVTKHVPARNLQELPLPFVAQGRELAQRDESSEVQGSHVEGSHLGTGHERRFQALLQAHAGPASRRDIHDRLSPCADLRQELHEDGRIRARAAVTRIACMKVKNGGARFGRGDGLLNDLLGSQRQVRRLARRMNRAGDSAGDDD